MRANAVTPEDFTEFYPRVWHIATRDSWRGIRDHGLLSTSALLDLFKADAAGRRSIERARRPKSIRIDH
jgi:hypothetical protein